MDKLDIVSKKIMINVDAEVSKNLAAEWEKLQVQIKKLKSFNTRDVVPMVRINDKPINFMREDIPGESLSKELILQNAPENDNNYIIASKRNDDD